jgi:uncharacterized protein with HEPN domain
VSGPPQQEPPPDLGSLRADRARFDTDELLQSAVLHWIQIIGEAARGVSDKVRTARPEVPWRVITGMRNRVSRGYSISISTARRWPMGTLRPST